MILPKSYEIKPNTPEKFQIHEGKPKLSYSQYTSWKDPLYKADYIRQYFFGLKLESGIYAEFGKQCGEYLSDGVVGNMLSKDDLKVLDSIERCPNAEYEREIVVDRGHYVIQGFIDYLKTHPELTVDVEDYKTGNADKKHKFYASQEYQQTTLYCKGLVDEGETINYSGVRLIGRKGDGDRWGPLRLSGIIKPIATTYSTERATYFLEDMDKVAKEISKWYSVYLKLNV